ncbi:hypothetical protein QVD17_11246 [Tagetes erecta]|uniref:Uncharacterized protein n=1 Tax=Tagetes erecta TaxID=13708 RepID=A0AAD8P1W4_TARER|nr:hypothetical protein QVD17_11246 [Tagetes erecta]
MKHSRAFPWPVRNFSRRALGVGKNRINENTLEPSLWPVRNFARSALGVGTQPARKTEYGSVHRIGP